MMPKRGHMPARKSHAKGPSKASNEAALASRRVKDLDARITGRFYTHEVIGRHLAGAVARAVRIDGRRTIKVIDPFAGDGRLVRWMLEALAEKPGAKQARWEITLWDCDPLGLKEGRRSVSSAVKSLGLIASVRASVRDTFLKAPTEFGDYQICVTNPPWEVLKPDRRELEHLSEDAKQSHLARLEKQDAQLVSLYPLAAKHRKFSGWGTNLARCGVEASLRLTAEDGICGFVSPASLLADHLSENLRTWLLGSHALLDVAYYSAEARLFDGVDQQAVTIVARPGVPTTRPPRMWSFDQKRMRHRISLEAQDWERVRTRDRVLPLQFGLPLLPLESLWADLPRFGELEGSASGQLWAGRELDETGHEKFLSEQGKYLFLKGRMVGRYALVEEADRYVSKLGPKIPTSADHYRIAWRDVSRPNQSRRMQATIIPPGMVTGNSLNIAYFRDDAIDRLEALLIIMNSLVFEAQVRSRLATAHLSLSSVRHARMPFLTPDLVKALSRLAKKCLRGDDDSQQAAEVVVATAYGMSRAEFALIVDSFVGVPEGARAALRSEESWSAAASLLPKRSKGAPLALARVQIPNHYAASLSELDLRIARAVPPGGNWKSIPESVPSARLAQIRESFAAGEGSRSTYYGRLRADAPSYTINTYFPRPGNGCHLHYDFEGGQHRTISQREAARLQSFPDAFVFHGSRSSVNQQIGNAVPPLLAYQIARTLPFTGTFVDLFSGAGGLALGFRWAGWKPVLANDIDESFLATYQANVHGSIVPGDIRDRQVYADILAQCRKARRAHPSKPFFVLGGPPCQGFSTAGNRRSMDDDRNWLFRQYKGMLESLQPDGFVFENVTGLLNMEGGRVFDMIRGQLRTQAKHLHVWKLRAEEYAVPQRRTRVVLVGDNVGANLDSQPEPVTRLEVVPDLFDRRGPAITVGEAVSDLPPLEPGEDGSSMNYLGPPSNPYQELMRGTLDPAGYLSCIRGRTMATSAASRDRRTRARIAHLSSVD